MPDHPGAAPGAHPRLDPCLTAKDVAGVLCCTTRTLSKWVGANAFPAPARAGRNPRTGAHVPVDQKSVPFFKTGKEMRERLNRDDAAPDAGA